MDDPLVANEHVTPALVWVEAVKPDAALQLPGSENLGVAVANREHLDDVTSAARVETAPPLPWTDTVGVVVPATADTAEAALVHDPIDRSERAGPATITDEPERGMAEELDGGHSARI